MGGETETKFSILTKISNLSVKYGKLKKKRSERNKWREVKKELQTVCGKLSEDDELMLMMRMRSEACPQKDGSIDIPPPSEMTIVRKRRH